VGGNWGGDVIKKWPKPIPETQKHVVPAQLAIKVSQIEGKLRKTRSKSREKSLTPDGVKKIK